MSNLYIANPDADLGQEDVQPISWPTQGEGEGTIIAFCVQSLDTTAYSRLGGVYDGLPKTAHICGLANPSPKG